MPQLLQAVRLPLHVTRTRSSIAAPSKGNAHHVAVIATGLDPVTDHTLRIEPVFDADKEQELRLESICVAGGDARVMSEKR